MKIQQRTAIESMCVRWQRPISAVAACHRCAKTKEQKIRNENKNKDDCQLRSWNWKIVTFFITFINKFYCFFDNNFFVFC
jgi:hypothetical protein